MSASARPLSYEKQGCEVLDMMRSVMVMSEAGEPDPYEALRVFLREQVALSPSYKPSGYEAVKAVLPEIKALKAKRRTDAEIRELLLAKGIKLSLATLRQYIQNATRELAGHKPVRRRGKAAAKTPADSVRVRGERRSSPEVHRAPARQPGPSDGQTSTSPTTGHRLSNKDL